MEGDDREDDDAVEGLIESKDDGCGEGEYRAEGII